MSEGVGRSRIGPYIALAVIIAASAWMMLRSPQTVRTVEIILPEFSPAATQGRATFNSVCFTCHGTDARGGNGGPPLIIPTYAPGHHADEAVRRAVTYGVTQHHWRFGNMPKQPDIRPEQIPSIVAFLREVQRANGVR